MVSSWASTRQRRILAVSYATGRYGRIRDVSPRQLPTNHDHDGESLHSIHEYQSDQPSTTATPAAVRLRFTPRPDHHHLKGRSISAYCAGSRMRRARGRMHGLPFTRTRYIWRTDIERGDQFLEQLHLRETIGNQEHIAANRGRKVRGYRH
jgi:hypothetical protein